MKGNRMATILEIRDFLLHGKRERQSRDDRRQVYGRFGEVVVEAWLRERRHLEVQAIPQTPGTRREILNGDGKRPNFLVGVPGDGSEPDLVLIDAKFHTIAEDDTFWIGDPEMRRYDSAVSELQAEWLFFAVVNARDPQTLHFVDRRDMSPAIGNARWVYTLGSKPGWSETLTAEELHRAAEQVAREGFDVSLLPALP